MVDGNEYYDQRADTEHVIEIRGLKPDNEYGERLKKMMMSGTSDRIKQVTETEINLCLKHPTKKIIYMSLNSTLGNPNYAKYDENKIMVFGGNFENAPIVLRKLHDYQKKVNHYSQLER